MTAQALLTEAQAAEALQLCTRTLRKARQEGKLRYVKYGRAIRYSPEDIAQFIDGQRCLETKTPDPSPPKPKRASGGKVIPFSQRG